MENDDLEFLDDKDVVLVDEEDVVELFDNIFQPVLTPAQKAEAEAIQRDALTEYEHTLRARVRANPESYHALVTLVQLLGQLGRNAESISLLLRLLFMLQKEQDPKITAVIAGFKCELADAFLVRSGFDISFYRLNGWHPAMSRDAKIDLRKAYCLYNEIFRKIPWPEELYCRIQLTRAMLKHFFQKIGAPSDVSRG